MRSFLVACVIILAVVASTLPSSHATISFVVQNYSAWVDSEGSLHIVGEVRNTGDMWLHFVTVTATLQGAGYTVDMVRSDTIVHYLPPGGVVPFDLVESDTTKSALVQSYWLTVYADETAPIRPGLVVMNVADSKNSFGWLEVVGEVGNLASTASKYTQVTGTFYDADGKVIYVGFTYTDPHDIPAGVKYPFKLTVRSEERSNLIARYSLIAESNTSGYTSVPETPWPLLMMVTALMVAVVAVRRKHRSYATSIRFTE